MDSLESVAAQIASGETSPRKLVEQALAAVAAREPDTQAWTHIDPDGARAQADALTAELAETGPRGPLHGVPCGIKDIFDVAGMPCEWGSAVMKGRGAEQDCAFVAELRKAGAIILGKTVTTSFAYFDPGPTRNPHNLEHTPGGSSSGSAAAVAAGMVAFAVGSQTMGSVLRPAAFCGVVGFKPSFGALPLEGVMPFSQTLDHAGLFTRTVEDMRRLWGALRPMEDEPPLLRVAALAWPIRGELEPAMAEGFQGAVERLRAAGVEVVEREPPGAFRFLPALVPWLMGCEALGNHGALLERHGEALGAKLAELLEGAREIPEKQYVTCLKVLGAARRACDTLLAEHPILATPSALGPAPRGLSSTGDPGCNAPWTALGVPAINLPIGAAGGLPIGLQLTAGRGREPLLLSTAARFEQILHGPEAVIASD
jgi:Asp-tRNA(Asn)/Glu-tRNA(Gln) amidotransferase A subunit family amidase